MGKPKAKKKKISAKDKILNEYVKKVKRLKKWPSLSELLPEITRNMMRHHFGDQESIKEEVKSQFPEVCKHLQFYADKIQKDKDDATSRIIESYLEMAKEMEHHPNEREYYASGVKKIQVMELFGSFNKLKEHIKTEHATELSGIYDDEEFLNYERRQLTRQRINKYKRQVWSSVGTGELDSEYLEGMLHYCKKNNAHVFLLLTYLQFKDISSDIKTAHMQGTLDIIVDSQDISRKLQASNICIEEKVVDPTAGIKRRAGDRSFIYASPKQTLQILPSKKKGFPRIQMSPGSLTLANYYKDELRPRKREVMADNDHLLGSIIIETEGDYFFARQTQKGPKGEFVDWGLSYHPDGSTVEIEDVRFVMGDLHSIDKHEETFELWLQLMKSLNVSGCYAHDVYDSASLNPHEFGKPISHMVSAIEGRTSLSNELKVLVSDLARMKAVAGHVFIIDSNHDDMLARSFDNSSIWKVPENAVLGTLLQPMAVMHQLRRDFTGEGLRDAICAKIGIDKNAIDKFFPALCKDLTLLQFACQLVGMPEDDSIKWLREEDSSIFGGFQLGSHGHKGIKGAKGSHSSFKRVIDKLVTGHTHTEIQSNFVLSVGNTAGNPRYARGGFSDWIRSGAIVYGKGMVQQIRSIMGRVRSFEGAYIHPMMKKRSEDFVKSQKRQVMDFNEHLEAA